MSPKLRPLYKEAWLKRTAMSSGELRRVEVMGRVRGKTLKVLDAAQMLELSCRQTKRLWQRYRQEGAQGLKHRSAGKISHRAKPEKVRGNVLRMNTEEYVGP